MNGPGAAFSPAAAPLPHLNVVDVVILVLLLLYCLNGIRRGFIAGVLALLGIIGALAAAVLGYHPAADLLAGYVALPPALGNIVGFLLVLIVARIILALLATSLLRALRPLRLLFGPLALLDHVLGFVPSLIQGLAVAVIVLTPLQLFPLYPPLTAAVDGSVIASAIADRVAVLTPQLQAQLGRVTKGDLLARPNRGLPPVGIR